MRYFDRHRKRLTKHHYIRGTLKSVSGEQEVKIEDSAGVPFNKIEIAGNTFQKTYKGYQQIEFLDFDKTITDDEGNVITWSCRNGVITVNGKTNTIVPITLTAGNKGLGSKFLKAGTYTFTVSWIREQGTNGVFGNTLGCDCRYNDTVTGEYKYMYISGRTVVTFENDVDWGYFQVYSTQNQDIENAKFAIGVFKGDVATADFPPYEPYVGGIPSPNPGQVISQNEIKKSQTDISASLNTEQYVLDPSGHMLIFKEPVIMDLIDPSLPVRFSIKNFHTGNADDMIFLAMNYDQFLLGSTCDLLASGDGSLYEFEFPGEAYPDGVYVGLGNMATPISQEDVYVSLAVEAGITATQTNVIEKPPLVIPAYPQEIVNANNSILPDGYQEIKALTSSGGQYINTGVLGKNTLRFYAKTGHTVQTLFGTQDTSDSNKCIAFANSYIRYLTSAGNQVMGGMGGIGVYELEISNTKATVYYGDNKSASVSLSPTDATIDYPIYLFARNTKGKATSYSSVSIYAFKIWDNDVLIRDFVPCYRKSDNACGMYDLVDGVFYTNQGSGAFIKRLGNGKEIVLLNNNLIPFGYDNYVAGNVMQNLGITYTIQEDGGIHCKGIATSSYSYIIFSTVSVQRFESGTYTLSAQGDNLPSGVSVELRKYDVNGKSVQAGVGTKVTKTLSSGEKIERLAIIIRQNTEIDCVVYPMLNFGTEVHPFVKGFVEEIPLPPSVEVEGATVDLNMANISLTNASGTYTATDYLTVDRLLNKVLYHQNVGKKTLTSTNMVWTWVSTYSVFLSRTNIGARRLHNPILANKYKGFGTVGNVRTKDYGITTDAQWWDGAWASALTIRDIRFNNLADFKADLDQNPLEIEYGLAEEITHDITSTELGQALLRLCVERGLDGTLRVESELGISSISCDYYSQESEDKVVLTVSYQNEAGEALMDDKTHNVRRGSKYQIVSPQIDGYEPTEKEAFGVADGDLTIILKYKEVSDVTV